VNSFNPEKYLEHYPFFSDNDRLLRHMRDDVLVVSEYESIMDEMIKQNGFNKDNFRNKLWMTDGTLKSLHKEGNVIGLHSYSHPMAMEQMEATEQ